MKFSHFLQVLSSFYASSTDGYHNLTIESKLENELQSDPQYVTLLSWLESVGLSISDLRVRKAQGNVTICNPGIWLVEGEPALLMGFDKGNPVTAPLPILVQSKDNLYSMMFGDEALPISARLQTDADSKDLPVMLSVSSAKKLAKPLGTGGGGKQSDWVKLRDIVAVDGFKDFRVTHTEEKAIKSKEGQAFNVYLLHTESEVLSVTYKQFTSVDSLLAYAKFSEGSESPVDIRVTHNGYYNGYMTFSVGEVPAQ
jgi:hypothetical protein